MGGWNARIEIDQENRMRCRGEFGEEVTNRNGEKMLDVFMLMTY